MIHPVKLAAKFTAAALITVVFCVFPVSVQSAASGDCGNVGLFKNFKPAKGELAKFKELLQMFELTKDDAYYKGAKVFNDGLSFNVSVEGASFPVVLYQYAKENGKLVYISARGKEIQPAGEEERLQKCFSGLVKKAVENNYRDHNFRLAEIAGKYFKLPPSEMNAALRKDTGYGVTLGEALKLQPMERRDFVPKTLYVGSVASEHVLAYAFLNSGIVVYGLQGVLWDYIVGEPQTLQHELIHKNPKLQSMPAAWQFDVELFASLAPFLDAESPVMDFISHGYLKTVRDMAKVYFGLDTAQIRREVIGYDYNRRFVINEAKLNKYSALAKEASAELKRASIERILPEFYADLPFWLAVNKKFNDQSAAFKVLMARDYEPTILGGYEKTAEWIERNGEVIRKITQEALKKLENPPPSSNENGEEEWLAGFLGLDRRQAEFLADYLRRKNVSVKDFSGNPEEFSRKINELIGKGEKR